MTNPSCSNSTPRTLLFAAAVTLAQVGLLAALVWVVYNLSVLS